jgi:hypothetical protein
MTDPNVIRNPDKYHEAIKPQDVKKWFHNLTLLSTHTTVYPDWMQLLHRGTKLGTLENLSKLARNVTHTPYPEVVRIHDPSDMYLLKHKRLVIKRGYSKGSNHIWMRTSPADLWSIRTKLNETEDQYSHHIMMEYGIKPMWFAVPCIPELVSKGEMHCFFIGGKLSYVVSTKLIGDETEVTVVDRVTPLCYLSYVFLVFKFIHN